MRTLAAYLAFISALSLGLDGCAPAYTQNTPAVSGQVFNTQTRQPMAGVTVQTQFRGDHIAAKTVTAADGSFHLPATHGMILHIAGEDPTAAPVLAIIAPETWPSDISVRYEPHTVTLQNAVPLVEKR